MVTKNMNVDHMVDKSNVYVNYVDINNADVNSVNMNKNTEPVCARAVKDICCELPFQELEEDKSKRSKLGDEDEKRHGSLYNYETSSPTVREDMHKKPEKRDVVDDINPEGKHDDEKTVEKQVHN
jgi:hypothetical protein